MVLFLIGMLVGSGLTILAQRLKLFLALRKLDRQTKAYRQFREYQEQARQLERIANMHANLDQFEEAELYQREADKFWDKAANA